MTGDNMRYALIILFLLTLANLGASYASMSRLAEVAKIAQLAEKAASSDNNLDAEFRKHFNTFAAERRERDEQLYAALSELHKEHLVCLHQN